MFLKIKVLGMLNIHINIFLTVDVNVSGMYVSFLLMMWVGFTIKSLFYTYFVASLLNVSLVMKTLTDSKAYSEHIDGLHHSQSSARPRRASSLSSLQALISQIRMKYLAVFHYSVYRVLYRA